MNMVIRYYHCQPSLYKKGRRNRQICMHGARSLTTFLPFIRLLEVEWYTVLLGPLYQYKNRFPYLQNFYNCIIISGSELLT